MSSINYSYLPYILTYLPSLSTHLLNMGSSFVSHGHWPPVAETIFQLQFLSHYRVEALPIFYQCYMPICSKSFLLITLLLLFFKEGIRDHKWPTGTELFINIGRTFRKRTTPFHSILSIHNINIEGNNFFFK